MVGLRVRPDPRRRRAVHRQHALRHAVPPRREPQRGRVLHHLQKPDPRVERKGHRRRGSHARAARRQGGRPAPHAERREVRRRARRPPAHVLARREAVQHVVRLLVRPEPRRRRAVHRQHALRRIVPPRRETERRRVLHLLQKPAPRVERHCGRRHCPDRPRTRHRTGPARQQPSNPLHRRSYARPTFHRFASPSNANGLRSVTGNRERRAPARPPAPHGRAGARPSRLQGAHGGMRSTWRRRASHPCLGKDRLWRSPTFRASQSHRPLLNPRM